MRGGIDKFGAFLMERNVLGASECTRMVNAANASGQPVDTVLIELGLVPEEQLSSLFAEYLDLDHRQPGVDDLNTEIIEQVGIDFLIGVGIAPVESDDDSILLAVADPLSEEATGMIGYFLDRPLKLTSAPRSRLTEVLEEWKLQNTVSNEPANEVNHSAELEVQDINRLKDVANEAPIIRLVNDIVQRAVDRNATDIHIEPSRDAVTIRLRCDGVLAVDQQVSGQLHAGLATRLKILSQLNIAERRQPQDGRMRMPVRGQEIDLRVSVLPSVHGETFVLRILDRTTVPLRLDALGYAPSDVDTIGQLARLSEGIVLVTGPTGSGKTTTLYSMLAEIDCRAQKVFTVEDPVEYQMPDITQVQVNAAIDLDFSRTLRTVLRQDPDVILVGEIRDRETAQIAIRAALTGHLVLSTLHTNSAAAAFSRLIDMGVEHYLLADTVRAVIGQRLLRRSCAVCGNQTCETCGGSGYSGRIAAYEILRVTKGVREAIGASATESAILTTAHQDGFETLLDHANHLAKSGVTDRAEVLRVLNNEGA